MLSSFLQSNYIKGIASIGILVITLVSATVFASWTTPTSPSDARSMFLNSGPVTQVKSGRLNIGSGAGSMALARFESTGPALLAGGFTADAGTGTTSAVILGDVYVGYQGSPAVAPSANTAASHYELNGNVTVSGSVIAGNLAHSGANPQPVCTDTNGWLIPCLANVLAPVCSDPSASNYIAGPYDPNMVIVDNTICTYSPSGCFIEGTNVLLADGTIKKIEDIAIGEILKGSDQDNPVMIRYVIDYTGPIYAINGSDYFVSATHPFMTTEGWKSFDPAGTRIESPTLDVSLLQKGDMLIKENGRQEILESYDYRIENRTVYNFGLNGSRDFYADGYLVHNVNLFPLTQRAEAAVQKGSVNICAYASYYSYALNTGNPANITPSYWNAMCSSGVNNDPSDPAPTTCSDNPCAVGQVCCPDTNTSSTQLYSCVWSSSSGTNACAE